MILSIFSIFFFFSNTIFLNFFFANGCAEIFFYAKQFEPNFKKNYLLNQRKTAISTLKLRCRPKKTSCLKITPIWHGDPIFFLAVGCAEIFFPKTRFFVFIKAVRTFLNQRISTCVCLSWERLHAHRVLRWFPLNLRVSLGSMRTRYSSGGTRRQTLCKRVVHSNPENTSNGNELSTNFHKLKRIFTN